MSTLTRQRGEPDPDYSDPSPVVKSSFVLQQEAVEKKAKKTKSTKSE